MNKNIKLITAVLTGVTAGIIVGMMFAPNKGDETRENISDNLGEAVKYIKQIFPSFKEDAVGSPHHVIQSAVL